MPLAYRTNPIRVDSNVFANHTMRVRVPAILREVQAMNPDYPDSIQQALDSLHDSVQNGEPIPHQLNPEFAHTVKFAEWDQAYAEQARLFEPLTWHNVEWFFAETYFYCQIMQAVDYYESGRDPFLPKKKAELASDALWELMQEATSMDASPREQIQSGLRLALWGNRIDLSYAASLERGASNVSDEDLLVDDSDLIMEHIFSDSDRLKVGTYHLVVDNTGTELAMDLVLLDTILAHEGTEVHLHVKHHPTFVSDAIVDDVWMLVDAMIEQGGTIESLGQRLKAHYETSRLKWVKSLHWNSGWLTRQFSSETINRLFGDAQLVIVKGDANYRRWVDDALWNPTTAYADVMDYFPYPLVNLRTLKSDPIVGLPTFLDDQLDKIDPTWRTNGQRGVIQFSR